MQINPHQELEPSTPVRVKGDIGTVVLCHHEKDQHGNPICVHEIDFGDKGKWKVNYSFVDVICSWCNKDATRWLMSQPFCDEHAKEFTEYHAKFLNKPCL